MEDKIDKVLKNLAEIFVEVKTIRDSLPKSKDDLGEDKLYGVAKGMVLKAKTASTSYLQRKLGIGYARAANLMDMLEKNKVIGPEKGAAARKVLKKDS